MRRNRHERSTARRNCRQLPWKEWGQIASALGAIATLIGVLVHLGR